MDAIYSLYCEIAQEVQTEFRNNKKQDYRLAKVLLHPSPPVQERSWLPMRIVSTELGFAFCVLPPHPGPCRCARGIWR